MTEFGESDQTPLVEEIETALKNRNPEEERVFPLEVSANVLIDCLELGGALTMQWQSESLQNVQNQESMVSLVHEKMRKSLADCLEKGSGRASIELNYREMREIGTLALEHEIRMVFSGGGPGVWRWEDPKYYRSFTGLHTSFVKAGGSTLQELIDGFHKIGLVA